METGKRARSVTPEVIAELRRLEAAATEPPWFYDEFVHEETPYSKRRVYRVEIKGDPRCRDCSPWREGLKRWSSRLIAQMVDFCDWSDHPSNRDLIIALRNAAPALLSAAEEAQRMRTQIAEYHANFAELRGVLAEQTAVLVRRTKALDEARAKLADTEQANRVAADLLSQMEARALAAESRTIPMVQEESEVVDE